jgi:hypothetical protein
MRQGQSVRKERKGGAGGSARCRVHGRAGQREACLFPWLPACGPRVTDAQLSRQFCPSAARSCNADEKPRDPGLRNELSAALVPNGSGLCQYKCQIVLYTM